MSLELAETRLSSRPGLRALVRPQWLAAEAARPAHHQHNLYATLEFQSDSPDVDAFLDGLERTIHAPVSGPYTNIAQRLVGSDTADYRSAVDEMSVATRLTYCGYAVTVSRRTPDVMVRQGSQELGIELTAPLKTRELSALQHQLASHWKWPTHRVMLFVGSATYRPTTREREAIAKAIESVASRLPASRTEVDLEPIVPRRFLLATVSPGWLGVVTASASYASFDPPAGIQEAIEKKRSQIRGKGDIVLAVNLGGLHVDPYSWSMHTNTDFRLGATPPPTVDAPADVLGVLTFNVGIPGQVLTLPIWLPNSTRITPDPPLLQPVLMGLGWPGPGVIAKPQDGL